MHKDTFFLSTFVLIAIIAILHLTAYVFFWYWTLWWFDILMHFLGGVWVGLSALWFFYLSGYVVRPKTDFKTMFLFVLASIIAIGVLWEIFEFAVGAYDKANYALDTTIDLTMDIIGSMIGLFIFMRLKLNLTTRDSLHAEK